jgi:hypothetical protein
VTRDNDDEMMTAKYNNSCYDCNYNYGDADYDDDDGGGGGDGKSGNDKRCTV